jgi:hypothetical protein
MKITEDQVEIVARHLHGLGWSSGGDYVEDFKPDVRAALSRMVSMPKSASQVSDNELFGMWSNSDFEGGDTDERSYALRNAPTAEPVAQADWRIGFFERWREAAHEKGYAGIAEAITAAPTAPSLGEDVVLAAVAANPNDVADQFDAPVPDGWVLVPREPTEAMLDAAMTREDDEPLTDWGKIIPAPHAEIYKAMLAAAPKSGEST